MFNSLLLELTLFGKQTLDVKGEAKSGNLPPFFATEKFLNSVEEKYNACILVDFSFRGIPSRTQAGFVVGGRAEIHFKGYALIELDNLRSCSDFFRSLLFLIYVND